MARAQVAAPLASFVSNRQNDFADVVQRSSLPADVKHMLHVINRAAWPAREDVAMPRTGEIIPPEVRKLALSIWRLVRKRHRLANSRGIAPVLDARVAKLGSSDKPHSDLWATFKFKGQEAFSVPRHAHARRRGRESKRMILQGAAGAK
jgi:putative transposase